MSYTVKTGHGSKLYFIQRLTQRLWVLFLLRIQNGCGQINRHALLLRNVLNTHVIGLMATEREM